MRYPGGTATSLLLSEDRTGGLSNRREVLRRDIRRHVHGLLPRVHNHRVGCSEIHPVFLKGGVIRPVGQIGQRDREPTFGGEVAQPIRDLRTGDVDHKSSQSLLSISRDKPVYLLDQPGRGLAIVLDEGQDDRSESVVSDIAEFLPLIRSGHIHNIEGGRRVADLKARSILRAFQRGHHAKRHDAHRDDPGSFHISSSLYVSEFRPQEMVRRRNIHAPGFDSPQLFRAAARLFHATILPVLAQEEPLHARIPERALTPVALLLVLLPYGIHVGTPALWDANEAFYVEGPREMQEAGDWLTPRFNFAEKLNKPILPYWLVLLSFHVFGVSEWAERVVILASSVATVLVTYWLGLLLFDRRIALWGALIVATSPKVIMVARRSLIDALLTAMIATAIYGLFSGWHRRNRAHLVLGYAALGAGVLTKGLIGMILPAGAFASYLLLTRRVAALRHLRLGLGALISLGIAAPWFAVMTWREGRDYLRSFFIGEHVSRYLHGTHGARRPFWYYLPTLLGEFAPWSFFLPLAIVVAWRSVRSNRCDHEGESSSPLSRRDGLAFLIAWFLFGFAFFSLSAAKQNEYLLPLYPAAALLVAHLCAAFPRATDMRLRRGFLLTVGVVSVALLIAARLLFTAARTLFPNQVLAYLPALVLTAAVPGLAWGGWRQRPTHAFGVLVATITVLHAAVAGLLPEIERYRPVRPLAERIRQEAGPEDLVGYYRYTAPSLCYYTRRKIFETFTPEELHALLRSGKRVFCVMREHDARELSRRYELSLRMLECRPSLLPLRMRELRRLRRPEDLERVCVVTNR